MKNTIRRFGKIIRYLISGGSAAVVNLSVYYVVVNVIYKDEKVYVVASIYAFLAAFLVSFLLQKYWTFKERTPGLVKKQMMMYLATAAMNIVLNIILLTLFIERFGFNNFFAQILSQGLIACLAFLIYQRVIFASKDKENNT